MAPKILENWSQNPPKVDFGPSISDFLAIWSDIENTRKFDTSLEAQKFGKMDQGAAKGTSSRLRLLVEGTVPGDLGPRAATRATRILAKRYKKIAKR